MMQSLSIDNRILSIGEPGDKLYFGFNSTGYFYANLCSRDKKNSKNLISNVPISINQWTHVTFKMRYKMRKAYVYFNGKCVGQQKFNLYPRSVLRSSNYIGSSNRFRVDALIDDLKIFNRSLKKLEIDLIMKRYIPNEYLSLTSFLQNEWTFNQNLVDSLGANNLLNPINISFSSDRLGSKNSSVYLNSGSINLTPGSYFNGDFTITAWINIQQITINKAMRKI